MAATSIDAVDHDWSATRLGLCSFCYGRTGRGTVDFVLEPFELACTVGGDDVEHGGVPLRFLMTKPRAWRACRQCTPLLRDDDMWKLAERTRAGERRLGARSGATLTEHAHAFRQIVDHLMPPERPQGRAGHDEPEEPHGGADCAPGA